MCAPVQFVLYSLYNLLAIIYGNYVAVLSNLIEFGPAMTWRNFCCDDTRHSIGNVKRIFFRFID